uniref:Ig-like domain-containing protein n=1 Tax=Oreochromis niloticus TaxID=8128 RepID=A0A669EG43_ORENI
MVLFYLLLTARMGGCSNDHNFVTKTVDVGQNVTLSCIRQHTLLHQDTLFWIRLVSGNQFEFLGGTFTFDYDDVNNTSHITVKQEPGTFIMQISKTKLSDTGLYYCIKVRQLAMTFLEGTFLTIKGPEPDVIQVRSSDRIHSGDQETLQCSVLSKYEKKTCLENPSVYWFRAGSDKSHSIYVHGNSGDECERSPEAPSQRKCVYSFSRNNISSSDAGTYYCAVATCGEILYGKGTKLDIQGTSFSTSFSFCLLFRKIVTVIFLLCPVLKKDTLMFSAVVFTVMKADKYKRKDAVKQQQIYMAVKAFGLD